jgi:hypothetical protein
MQAYHLTTRRLCGRTRLRGSGDSLFDKTGGFMAEQDRVRGSRRASIALGVAIGAMSVIALLTVSAVASAALSWARREDQPAPVVRFAPVEAGARWFSVSSAGTGTVTGFQGNGSGSGSEEPTGTIGYIDFVAAGNQDGVLIRHQLPLYLESDTQITVGGRVVTAKSIIEANNLDTLSGSHLTVEFRRAGTTMIATRIIATTADPESLENEVLLW